MSLYSKYLQQGVGVLECMTGRRSWTCVDGVCFQFHVVCRKHLPFFSSNIDTVHNFTEKCYRPNCQTDADMVYPHMYSALHTFPPRIWMM